MCLDLIAEVSPSVTGTGTTNSTTSSLIQFIPIILILVVFYFLVFSAKRKQDKERKGMLENLKKGDRIQTIGGALGTVIQVDESEVLVKVDETSNTKIRFVRAAIHKVLTDDIKTESK